MKKPRVLMIGLTPPVEGGSERVIYELASRIEDCDVLTQKGSICKREIGLPIPKRPIFLRNLVFAFLARIYVIFLLLTFRKKYDIIHIHENLLYPCAIPLSLRYKVFVTVHGIKGFKFYDNKFLWFFFRQGLKFSERVIAVSLSDKRLLERDLKRVVYLPNGVDLRIYDKTKAKSEKKISFIGRIHEQKGIIYLLEAFDKITDKYPDYKLEIIGDLNAYSKELRIKYPSKRILWRGFINNRTEIARSLKSAYCIVLPSLWEGLPLTLFESLATKRPVIVSDIQSFKDVVDREVLFFKSKNSEELARKMTALLKNREMADRLGKAGAKIAAKHDWKEIASKLETLYGRT